MIRKSQQFYFLHSIFSQDSETEREKKRVYDG